MMVMLRELTTSPIKGRPSQKAGVPCPINASESSTDLKPPYFFLYSGI